MSLHLKSSTVSMGYNVGFQYFYLIHNKTFGHLKLFPDIFLQTIWFVLIKLLPYSLITLQYIYHVHI